MTNANAQEVAGGNENLIKPSFELLLVRHAAYSLDEEHPETLGHLTPEGVQQARKLGQQVYERAKDMGGDVDISFISSPQPYDSPRFPMHEQSGRRAEETALAAIEAILEQAESENNTQIRVASPVPSKKPDTPYNQRLVEQNIYYVELNKDGELNPNPFEYIKNLREKYGENWKEQYLRGGDTESNTIAQKIGAETSHDLSARIMSVIHDVAKLAEDHDQRQPGRKMLFVLVAHDGILRSVIQNELSAGPDAYDKLHSLAEIVPVHVDNGVATLEFQGKEYESTI